jgi:hypothetical protein
MPDLATHSEFLQTKEYCIIIIIIIIISKI